MCGRSREAGKESSQRGVLQGVRRLDARAQEVIHSRMLDNLSLDPSRPSSAWVV